MQKLERTTFETSRDAEYFSREGLRKQTGQRPDRFAEVVIKELADNALDAAEYAGVVPEVKISAMRRSTQLALSVADNGSGIEPEVVEKILNFSTRTSDKAAYRSPTRGAQGNALKTIVGMPHALGTGEAPVLIHSHGAKHLIKLKANPAGEIHNDHVVEADKRWRGTSVTVVLPSHTQRFDDDHLLHWGRAIAVFNPHAFVKIDGLGAESYHANSEDMEPGVYYKPLTDSLTKYTPGEPTSAHWYDERALAALVFSHIEHARKKPDARDLPLGEFVRQFAGLKSTAKAREVCGWVKNIRHLSDFEHSPGDVALLLAGMQHHSKAPTHKALGRLGKEHIEQRFEEFYERVYRLRYKHFQGCLPSGLPYTFEFAVADVDELGDLFVGVNYSPTFSDPLGDLRFKGPKYGATGIENFLEDGFAHPTVATMDDPDSPYTAVVAHIITPAPLFMEYGKTRLDLLGRR
jgi:Histidine kinase-, DNA gyrase B-, and HSP90-like ATPase